MTDDALDQQTDPGASRPPWRFTLPKIFGAVLLPVLLVATGALWWLGGVTPRFELGGDSDYGADRGTIYYGFSVRNTGNVPMTIISAGRRGDGLELTSVEGTLPITLRHGEQTRLTLRYRIVDCAAVTSDPWPIPVTVKRPWGPQTVHLALSPQDNAQWQGPDLPPLLVVRTGPVEWQRSQADLACAMSAVE